MATALANQGAMFAADRVRRLEEELALAREALVTFVPVEPEDAGSVIRFRKYNGGYTFAAIKVVDRWYVTQDGRRSSRQGHGPKYWDELLDWIGQRNWDSIEELS